MNEYKKQYIDKKNEILQCMEETERFLSDQGFSEDADSVRDNIETLKKGEFSISVVGEFSAGKSTFLNALMGEKILPSFSNETTATINFLRHKDRAANGECGVVVYKDGREEKLNNADIETISRYVSTASSDVKVAQCVDHLDLYLDSRFLEDNVTLVDTPGLNGIAEGHREITQEQIKRSSAGIFLFNANQPGSRSDFEFLSEFRKRLDSSGKGNSILYVLNKIDSIKKSEGETVESVVNKLKDNYRKVYPDATTIPEIWPIAAYPALVARSEQQLDYNGKNGGFTDEEKNELEALSRLHSFEDRLWKFLTQGEKAKQELMGPVTQLIAVLKEKREKCERELELLNGTVDQTQIEEERLKLQKSKEELEEKLEELTRGMRRDVQNAENDFYNAIKTGAERTKDRLKAKFDNFEDVEEIDPNNIQKKIQNDLNHIAVDAYEEYASEIRRIISTNAGTITDSLNDTLSSDLHIKLDGKLELPSVKIGLEEYEKEASRLKAEIKNLEQEAEKASDDMLAAMLLDQQRQLLEEKLRAKQEQKEHYEETHSLLYAPEIKQREKAETRKKWFNKFGKTEIQYVKVYDSTERDEFIAERNKKLSRYDDQIAQIEEQLAALPVAHSNKREEYYKRKDRLVQERRSELIKHEKDFAEKIKSTRKHALKMQKNEIEEYVDRSTDDFITQAKKEFRNNRNIHVDVMKDMIGGSVVTKINRMNQELTLLEEKMKNAASERTENISRLTDQQNGIIQLMSKALELQSEVSDIEADVIKEEAL